MITESCPIHKNELSQHLLKRKTKTEGIQLTGWRWNYSNFAKEDVCCKTSVKKFIFKFTRFCVQSNIMWYAIYFLPIQFIIIFEHSMVFELSCRWSNDSVSECDSRIFGYFGVTFAENLVFRPIFVHTFILRALYSSIYSRLRER